MFWPEIVIAGFNLNALLNVIVFPPVPLDISAPLSVLSGRLAVTDKVFTKVLLSWSADVSNALNLKYLPSNSPVVKFWNELKVTLSSLVAICNVVLQFCAVLPSNGSGVPLSIKVVSSGLPVSIYSATFSIVWTTVESNLVLNLAGNEIVFAKS